MQNLKNGDSPFTEIFSILMNYEQSNGVSNMAYPSENLKQMKQHLDNVIETLLQGLQDIGHVIHTASIESKKYKNELSNIGYFISSISNLTEALNTLRLDTGYELPHRGENAY